MSVQAQITENLKEAPTPEHLDVVNESDQHNVPPGSESDFKVIVVSDSFTGKRPVARHQSIYKVLAEQLAGPVHALALHTYSPAEWQARSEQAPESPECLGGSKADRTKAS